MASEIKKLIRARVAKKARFSRQCLCAKVKLADTWRRPRGLHSKQRKDFRAKGAHPEAGFGAPAAIRTAVRIGASVGGQKRAAIQTKAASLGIKVLNPKETKAAVAALVTEEAKTNE